MGLCPDSISPCICMCVCFVCSHLITLTSVCSRSRLICTLPCTFQSPKKQQQKNWPISSRPSSSLSLIFPPHGFDLLALDFQPEPGRQKEQTWWGETFLVWPLESHTILFGGSMRPPAVRLRLIVVHRGQVTDMFGQ